MTLVKSFLEFVVALLQGVALLGMGGSFLGASIVGYWMTDMVCATEERYRYKEFRRKALVVFVVSLILYFVSSMMEVGI